MSLEKLICRGCGDGLAKVHIRCVECPDMELCPECFSGKVEVGEHRSSHSYKIIDDMGFSLFNPGGTAKEQMLVLDLIERHGFGNWEDVAKSYNSEPSVTNKSSLDIQQEFSSTFLHGALGQKTWKEELRGSARDHTNKVPIKDEKVKDEITSHESILLGYLPIRDDFEVEHENTSEEIISQLQYQPTSSTQAGQITPSLVPQDEDEILENELKVAHVEIYKDKLRDREKRKRLVRDHSLISQFFKENPITYDHRGRAVLSNPRPPKKSSGKTLDLTCPEVWEKMKMFSEFLGVNDFRTFMANVQREKEVRHRIKDLYKFRKNGIRLLTEGSEFESQQKARRISRKRLLMSSSPMSIKSESDFVSSSPVPPIAGSNFCITNYPGYEILSSNEKKLCTNLKLTPAHYISYKTCLLSNHLQKKKGQTPKPLNPAGLDKNNRKVIFNFLIRAGWITAY